MPDMNLYGAFDGSKRPGTLFVAFPGSPHQCLEHAWVPEKLSDPDEHIDVKELAILPAFFRARLSGGECDAGPPKTCKPTNPRQTIC